MRYLALALACEGPTDLRFLGDVVERTAHELLMAGNGGVVEMGPVTPVYLENGARLGNQPDKVVAEFVEGRMFADVLIVHADGAGRSDELVDTVVTPIAAGVAALEDGPAVVPLIPVRETEAWMLADVGALTTVLGVGESDIRPSEPPGRVERILDPKSELEALITSSHVEPGRRRRKRREHRVASLYGALGVRTDLAELRVTASFAAFERTLSSVLTEKGYT